MVCHWDQHERRRTSVLSPMYREWPVLERRTGINQQNPTGSTTLTAPFGEERFIHFADENPAPFSFNGDPWMAYEEDHYTPVSPLRPIDYQRDERIATEEQEVINSLWVSVWPRKLKKTSLLNGKKILPRENAPRCSAPRWVAIGPQEFDAP